MIIAVSMLLSAKPHPLQGGFAPLLRCSWMLFSLSGFKARSLGGLGVGRLGNPLPCPAGLG